MRQSPENADDFDLDLPALDGGEEDALEELGLDALDVGEEQDGADMFDDATGEDAPFDELTVEGAEGGWLLDAEQDEALDIGPFDVVLAPEGSVLDADVAEVDLGADLDDLVSTDESFVADGGEEGPLAADEELREEDLPALDADEEGDVPDEDLFDRALLVTDDDLRWDDRAWARASADAPPVDDAADSGLSAVPGEDAETSVRDAAWKQLEASGRVMAAAFVPGGSVVVALATPDRARAFIVRIQLDGEARIIAEIDPRGAKAEDDGAACTVTLLRWDAARGSLFAFGNFGVEAFCPSERRRGID